MENSGILSLIELNDKENKLYLEYIRKKNDTAIYDFVYYLLGDSWIKFLDLTAGANLKVPSRSNLFRDIDYIKIYNYVVTHGDNEDAMKGAAKIYNKKVSYVRKAVSKVKETLNSSVVEEDKNE